MLAGQPICYMDLVMLIITSFPSQPLEQLIAVKIFFIWVLVIVILLLFLEEGVGLELTWILPLWGRKLSVLFIQAVEVTFTRSHDGHRHIYKVIFHNHSVLSKPKLCFCSECLIWEGKFLLVTLHVFLIIALFCEIHFGCQAGQDSGGVRWWCRCWVHLSQ